MLTHATWAWVKQMRLAAGQPNNSNWMMERVVKKTSRAERKARRPHEILEAAFEEFAAKGYAATRVEDIATRLRITKGTVYLYFPTKDDLFQEMFRHASTSSADLSTAIGSLRGSCADRIRDLLLIAYENTANDRKTRELLRLSVAEGTRLPEMVDCRHELFIAPTLAALTALVEEGVKSGELRHDTATDTPDVLASSIFQIAVWHLMLADRKPIDGRALMEAHINLVMNGLLRRSKRMA
jgi:AcrR family transcriptional regulator